MKNFTLISEFDSAIKKMRDEKAPRFDHIFSDLIKEASKVAIKRLYELTEKIFEEKYVRKDFKKS